MVLGLRRGRLFDDRCYFGRLVVQFDGTLESSSVDCIASVVCYVWYSLFVIHIMTFLYLLCYVLLFS